MKVDMSAEGISSRLRVVAAITDLDPSKRTTYKVNYDATAITGRLREVSRLLALCNRLDISGRG